MKTWYMSKTIITSVIAFLVAVLTGAGIFSVEDGTKIESLLIPLIFVFLRIGDKPIGTETKSSE